MEKEEDKKIVASDPSAPIQDKTFRHRASEPSHVAYICAVDEVSVQPPPPQRRLRLPGPGLPRRTVTSDWRRLISRPPPAEDRHLDHTLTRDLRPLPSRQPDRCKTDNTVLAGAERSNSNGGQNSQYILHILCIE